MADEDYYDVLGVSRSASEEEIQKAYRKLARKYHPDLHVDADQKERERAKQQFQKVQQAYDVLSDSEKRQMYDQLGPDFEKMGGNPFGGGRGGNPFGGGAGGIDLSQLFGGGGGGGFEDILRQMGGGGMGGRAGGGQPRAAAGRTVEQEITIPFSTAVLGGKHQVSLSRSSGKVDHIDVTIPAGIEGGKKIRLRGQGHPGSGGGPAGDLIIKVNIAPHPVYTRKGLNLLVTVPVSVIEAAEGAKIDLPTPHGTVSLTVPRGSSSGKSLRLKGMGVKAKDRSGDLIATLQVHLPSEISEQDLKLLNQLSDSWLDVVERTELTW